MKTAVEHIEEILNLEYDAFGNLMYPSEKIKLIRDVINRDKKTQQKMNPRRWIVKIGGLAF